GLQGARPRWECWPILRTLGVEPVSAYAVLTLHRPSNVDDAHTLANFLEAFETLARHIPIVFPVHPRVKQQLVRQGYGSEAQGDARGLPRGKGVVVNAPPGHLRFLPHLDRAPPG